jgi:Spy/CpxP family protein refolding chaperone
VPWWKDAAVIKEISLTSEQAARIDAVWRKRETEMHGVAVEAKKQQDELTRLVAERKVGVDVIGLQFDRNEALRSMLAKSRAIALYQTSLILTTEQNKALKAIGERNRRERR